MFRIQFPLPSRRELERQYDTHYNVYQKVLHEVQRRVAVVVQTPGVSASIKYRIKRFDSLYEKLLRRARSEVRDEDGSIAVTDLLGIRVVSPFMEDLGIAEKQIVEHFEVVEIERKGSQLGSSEFGYNSVHLLVQVPRDILESFHVGKEIICEVQLRTILQDAWAEVEHELVYKAELTPLDGQLRRKLAALNANLTLSDIIFQEIREYQRVMNRSLMKRREDFWTLLQKNGRSDEVDTSDAGDAEMEPEVFHTGSDTIDSMLIKALHAHNTKDYAEAERLYTDILAYQPPDHVTAVVLSHRGMTRFALDKLDKAIDDFTRTIEISPQTTRAYYYRAVVMRVLERDEDALMDFSRCLEFDPYNIDSRIARARLYIDMNDKIAAQADCRMAQKLDPDNEMVLKLCQELGEERILHDD